MNGLSTFRTSFYLFTLTILLFTSCGIPNPIPADIDTLYISNPQNLKNGLSAGFHYLPVSTVPTSGFNLYYLLSNSETEEEDATLSNLIRLTSDDGSGGYRSSNPIASLDQSQIDSATELYVDILWDVDTYLLSLAIYSDLNRQQTISINGIEGSVNIYSADGSSFDLVDTQGKGYIQFYIAYFIQDPSYSPNRAYSNIEYIGFIDVNDLE